MGTNGCPSSIELDAQNVQPHQTTIKRKRTTPKVVNLPVLLTRVVKAETAEKKVSGCSDHLHIEGVKFPRNPIWTTGAAGHFKVVQNRKANCCTLLKRITRLKCVNSDVKSVHIHPQWGSLKWVHGTMSEPPWKSH